MSLLFTAASVEAAPRAGLAMGALLTWATGLVSMLRIKTMAGAAPDV